MRPDHCICSSSGRGDILAGLDAGGAREIQIGERSRPAAGDDPNAMIRLTTRE
jgi:hypothetical protein